MTDNATDAALSDHAEDVNTDAATASAAAGVDARLRLFENDVLGFATPIDFLNYDETAATHALSPECAKLMHMHTIQGEETAAATTTMMDFLFPATEASAPSWHMRHTQAQRNVLARMFSNTTTDTAFLSNMHAAMVALHDHRQESGRVPAAATETATDRLVDHTSTTELARYVMYNQQCHMLCGNQSASADFINGYAWVHSLCRAVKIGPPLFVLVSFLVRLLMLFLEVQHWTEYWHHLWSMLASTPWIEWGRTAWSLWHAMTTSWQTMWSTTVQFFWQSLQVYVEYTTWSNVLGEHRAVQSTWTQLQQVRRDAMHTLQEVAWHQDVLQRSATPHVAWKAFHQYVARAAQYVHDHMWSRTDFVDSQPECVQPWRGAYWVQAGRARAQLWHIVSDVHLGWAWQVCRQFLMWSEWMDTLGGHVRAGKLSPVEWVSTPDADCVLVHQRFLAQMHLPAAREDGCDGTAPGMEGDYAVAVPATVSLDRSMTLTGENGTGKTTLTKATLVNLLLAHSIGVGCFAHARICPFHRFDCLIEKVDTHHRDSLFEAEARRTSHLIQSWSLLPPDTRVFVVFDEMFTGTNATDAAACIVSTLTFIHRTLGPSRAVFQLTTHFLEVARELQSRGVAEAWHMQSSTGADASPSVSVEGESEASEAADAEANKTPSPRSTVCVRPTFQLKRGVAELRRGAMSVMQRMHFPDEVIADAIASSPA